MKKQAEGRYNISKRLGESLDLVLSGENNFSFCLDIDKGVFRTHYYLNEEELEDLITAIKKAKKELRNIVKNVGR